MPGYYYRPIDPGYGDVGASIGSGLVGGTAGFLGERQAGRDRKRRESLEDMDLNILLASKGGGRGPLPTETYDPAAGTGDLAVSPDGIRMPRVAALQSRLKAGFTQVGPDAYIRDPQALEQDQYRLGRARAVTEEEEDYQRVLGREGAERAERQRRLGGPAAALLRGGDINPDDVSALVGEGMDLGSIADLGRPRAPVRGTQAYLDMLDAEQGVYDRHQAPVRDPVARGIPTFPQAEKWLFDEFGDELPSAERFDLAQAMARGEDPFEAAYPDLGAMAGMSEDRKTEILGQGPKPRLRRGAAPAAAGAVLDSPPTPEEIDAADAALPPDATEADARKWIADQRARRR